MSRPRSWLPLAGGIWLVAGCRSGQAAVDRALERMSQQPRYDVYESSDFFPNGMVLQKPPAGTVARDAVLDPEIATGRSASGAYLTELPFTATPELLERGRTRFRIYCAACHGAGGYGGSIIAANMPERRPPSLRTRAVSALPPGFFYEVIRQGLGRMPSYAAELPVADRWAVVAYLRELQRSPIAPGDQRSDSIRGAELRAQDSARRAASGDSIR